MLALTHDSLRSIFQEDQPIGVVYLDDYTVSEAPEADRRNTFKIETKPRIWYLTADRQVEMDLWIICIKAAKPWYLSSDIVAVSEGIGTGKSSGSGGSSAGGGSSTEERKRKTRNIGAALRLSSYLGESQAISR